MHGLAALQQCCGFIGRWAPHTLAIALAQILAALAILTHARRRRAAPRLAIGERWAATLRVEALSRRRRCWRWWLRWRHARAARFSAAGVPIAIALRAPILAFLAPITVDCSIAGATPRGHLGPEGRAAAFSDVASRVAFRTLGLAALQQIGRWAPHTLAI